MLEVFTNEAIEEWHSEPRQNHHPAGKQRSSLETSHWNPGLASSLACEPTISAAQCLSGRGEGEGGQIWDVTRGKNKEEKHNYTNPVTMEQPGPGRALPLH